MNYQKPERFLHTINSTGEMIHCYCFVMTSLVPVNMDFLTSERLEQ